MLFILIFSVFVSCCNLVHAEDNYKYKCLLSNDTIVLIKDVNNIEELIKTVCEINCKDDKSFTGDFSLQYSLKNKSFTKFIGDSFLITLPFIGYKCPNSLYDCFYTSLKLRLETNVDSIPNMVKTHIIKTRYNNNYPPLIELIVEMNIEIEKLAEIINQVIIGYLQIYEEITQARWKKGISALSKEEILILRKMEPLRIRITPKNSSLYCE